MQTIADLPADLAAIAYRGEFPSTVHLNPFEACIHASTLIRAAGFELAYRATSTETLYYRWPGRTPLLRLSTHSHSRTEHRASGLAPIAATLTFREAKTSQEHARLRAAQAIGIYMIKTGQG